MEKKLLEVLKMPLIILQHLSPDSATLSEVCCIIQGVRLATEPGISLIILTPMKILQRNSNRSMFIVWEMWHHNMCWKWTPFASRQDW